MNRSLRELLHSSAGAVPEPRLDVTALVAEAGRRRRRHRVLVVATATAAVGAVALGALAVKSDEPRDVEPAPSPPPSPPGTVAVDTTGTRPLVYAEGRTVHVGDRTVRAEEPPGFVDVTDDGAVFEATLDNTLWFTDGTTTTPIGTTTYTAAPTFHGGVWTGDTGSLVVWGDVAGRPSREPTEMVVFDTSRLEEVGRFPFVGQYTQVVYVDDDQVYFTPDNTTPGCWLHDVQGCDDPHLFRYDVVSGETTEIGLAELDADMATHARVFVADVDETDSVHDLHQGARFTRDGRTLVHAYPSPLTRSNGVAVRLRVPSGWTAPGPGPEGFDGLIQVSQWLDDDTVVVWADDGGGDLPAKEGAVLVCRLQDGVCRVVVRPSSRAYVLPVRAFY
jgi:hypothetical protein